MSNIPEEAFEAAKQALWRASDLYGQMGGDLSEHQQREASYERIARRVLEAAAPHISYQIGTACDMPNEAIEEERDNG